MAVAALISIYCLCQKKNCVIKNQQNNDLPFYKNQNISKEIIKFEMMMTHMTHTNACFLKFPEGFLIPIIFFQISNFQILFYFLVFSSFGFLSSLLNHLLMAT